ncbi:MAG TPA: MBL fold metallo-hydrolase [Sediminibacterium sp.]|nr:MBL fold metallo-hydrolase [Sediminibacterium sp.]
MQKLIFKSYLWLSFFCLCTVTASAQYGELDTAARVAPFKIFDNLYYVGNKEVSAYILSTEKGLVLIDALYGKFVRDIPAACTRLGLHIQDIRYILCTHAHYDHCEGAAYLQQLTHAKVGMTEPDWEIVEGKQDDPYKSILPGPKRDWVIHDGDSLVLGKTILYFMQTPGHTVGVLSILLPVKDGGKTYQACMFGGIGLNFEGVVRTQQYLASVARLQELKNISVNLTNHPGPGKIFERAARLQNRKPGGIQPFVDPAGFADWLEDLKKAALKKLANEKAKTQ